ncbi:MULTISPECIES: SIR2 family NAD-dependent protein deacylase [Psychrobacter]|uniref:NAD-dependent protein deacylase n=1 Tax=Psychrobacter halodurans TaxID=2818439 RepID=A0AAW4IM87_9GAMM|nr:MULTISPECIES: NAD-dependent deacylase [Psychrobacter]MBO1516588.1 NAD-dependent deacylase [Psychrobacter halodurans]PJX26793.1 NAD-dependent protein deacylase [Psychrobacter sp. L7]
MLAELTPALIAEVERAAQLLKSKSRICILTGAGISAESGIPTFRDKQTGLWENYGVEDLATPEAFTRDPKLVWSWYQWRRQLVADKAPNPAHHALAQWQYHTQTSDQTVTLITQNVDDLHEQAGSSVTHLHGHLWRNRCGQCNAPYQEQSSAPSDHQDIMQNTMSVNTHLDMSFDNTLLTCSHCGGYIRPDIVWFGEALPVQAWQTAEEAAANCEVFISIGTSSLVYPAAGLAQLAKQNGAQVMEINPNPTPNTIVDITFAEKAGVILPPLIEAITDL